MTNKQPSVEEIVEEILKGVPTVEMAVDIGGEMDMVDVKEQLEGRIEHALQTERQKREEVVEATEKQTVLTFSKNILEIYNRDPQGALYILEQNAYEALTQTNNPK